jgi:hypothetical protein
VCTGTNDKVDCSSSYYSTNKCIWDDGECITDCSLYGNTDCSTNENCKIVTLSCTNGNDPNRCNGTDEVSCNNSNINPPSLSCKWQYM